MGGLNPLDQIQPWVIVATIGIFVVTLFALRRVFFLPYIEVMERRETELDAAEAKLADADRIADEARAQADEATARARVEADAFLRTSRERDEAYRRQVLGDAQREATATLEGGRAGLATEREAEVERLREQAVECVGLACERLLGSPDMGAVRQEVDKLLARRLQ